MPLGCRYENYVWLRYVRDSGFTRVGVVAYGTGGGGVREIMSKFGDTFYK